MSNLPMRVLVVGSGGRLGAAVVRHLREMPARFRVVAYDHKAMDLLRPSQIDDHLEGIQFDALINCAALTSLEVCEDRPDDALQINRHAAEQMAFICQRKKARMIQISTDYVYDGSAPGQKTEQSPTAPLGTYARTKLAGDEAVLAVSAEFLVARVSWVFGPDRPSFVDQLLLQARTHDHLEAIADKFSTPTSALELARWLAILLEKPEVTGVLNLCNSGTASWHTYASYALEVARELGWPQRTISVTPTKLVDIKSFRSPRPIHTSMDSSKLARIISKEIPSWRDALREYLTTYYVLSS
jgi:dTDP-4-dehydrorhamnose reductase